MKPPAIICDLDGTLADMNGRDPYDATTCEQDLPHFDMIDFIDDRKERYPEEALILLTGRSETWRKQTLAWLNEYGVSWELLLMRHPDDKRKASVMKWEAYEIHIKPRFQVRFTMEDMPSEVAMWRKNNVKCLAVKNGRFLRENRPRG